MDTSEQYIKQCEKAGEIQNYAIHIAPIDLLYHKTDENLVWLPRQDQLQEMVGEEDPKDLTVRFSRFCDPYYMRMDELVYVEQFTSMEQLWLAFCMKERFGKVWSDGEWVEDRK